MAATLMESLESRLVFAAPAAPTPIAPGDAAAPGPSLTSMTPTFSWSASSGASRYGLYIRDLSTDTLVYSKENITGTSFRIPSGTINNNRPYRWNVSAFNSAGEVSYSPVKYVATGVPQLFGIDVSKWQGNINWTGVKNAGKSFAFIRASGKDGIDPYFTQNVNGAAANGIVMGFYHRVNPAVNTAIYEADLFVNAMGSQLKVGRMRPVMDFEDGSELGKDALTAWAQTFLDRVQSRTGQRPIIYANTNYASNFAGASLNAYDLWVANWKQDPQLNPATGIWPDWSFWQYSATGSVGGISGNVDLDVFQGTRANLLKKFVIQPAKGDMDGNGVVNNADISAFVQALTNRSVYDATYPLFSADVIGDMNNDGAFNNSDIDAFVGRLTGNRPAMAEATAKRGTVGTSDDRGTAAGDLFSDGRAVLPA